MIRFQIPIIVEGRYDKAHLSSLVDAMILTTDGFGVFKSPEKRALIRRLGEKGLILLCDSDGGGKVIRSHLKGQLSGIPVYDLYVPQIPGKERRKASPSKEGYLGVEGVPAEILRKVLADFAAAHPELTDAGELPHAEKDKTPVSRALLYELGLSGGPDASAKRDALAVQLGLPRGMNAGALFAALSMISSEEEVRRLVEP